MNGLSEPNANYNERAQTIKINCYAKRKPCHNPRGPVEINSITSEGKLIKIGPRPIITVTINQIEVNGLLDSGASISILGQKCVQYLDHWNGKEKKSTMKVKTADGRVHECSKSVILPIHFKGKHRNIRFYITPTINSSTIFGTNFWEGFNIKPVMFPGNFKKQKPIRNRDRERDLPYSKHGTTRAIGQNNSIIHPRRRKIFKFHT